MQLHPIHSITLTMLRFRCRWASLCGFFLMTLFYGGTRADDWPQWLGPHRDSVWREKEVIDRIPDEGLKVKWRVAISGGYTGPAVADDLVYVMDYVTDGDQTPNPDKRNELDGMERVLCFQAATGDLVWKHEYDCPYQISYPAGPRATPTIHQGRVYALGAEGNLNCLDAQTGKIYWQRDFKRDYGATTPIWGYCGHPLVHEDNLICMVGGPYKVVAFDRQTGKEIWRALDGDDVGYSAPTLMGESGAQQLLIWHATALASLNPNNGEVFWSEPLEPSYGMSIIVPRWSGELIFVGGIVNKSMMVRLDDTRSAEVAWYGSKDVGIDPVHSTPFAENGYLYGVTREGKLSAIQMDNGRTLWSNFDLMPDHRRVHSGTVFIVKNEDRFFLMTDSGELVIAQMSPTGYREHGRAKILNTTGDAMGREVVWSHPAFADRCIFARNDQELVCISLAQADY